MPIVVEVVSADEVREVGRRAEEGDSRPPPTTRRKTWDLDGARARAARRCTPRTASPVTRRTAWACRHAFPALAGSKIVNGPAGPQIETVLNGKPGTAMQAFGKQLSDTEHRRGHHLRAQFLGQQGGRHVQPAEVKAARK